MSEIVQQSGSGVGNSPRTVAALRRLGLRREDLQQASADDLAKWAAGDKDGLDLQKQRRLRLLQAVRVEREGIPARTSCTAIVRTRSEAGTSSTSAAARLVKFQHRARENVRKMVDTESTKLDIVEKRRERDGQLADRRRHHSASLAEKRAQEEKKRDVILKRRAEKLDKAAAEHQEAAQQAAARAADKLQRGIATRAAALNARKQSSVEKRIAIETHQRSLLEEKQEQLQAQKQQQCENMEAKDVQVRASRQQLQIEVEHRRQEREVAFEAIRACVLENAEEFDRETVASYNQYGAKSRLALQRNQQREDQTKAQIIDRNCKRNAKSVKGLQREKDRRIASEDEAQQILAAKNERTHAFMEKRRLDGFAGAAQGQQRKSLWRDLAVENRGQVRRAGLFRQGGVLKTVQDKINRVDAGEEARVKMLQERRDVAQEVWLQKEHFSAIADKLSTANSRSQFSKLCSQLGVDTNQHQPKLYSSASNGSLGQEDPGSPIGQTSSAF